LTDDIVVYVQGPNGTKELEDAPSRDLIDAAIAEVS